MVRGLLHYMPYDAGRQRAGLGGRMEKHRGVFGMFCMLFAVAVKKLQDAVKAFA